MSVYKRGSSKVYYMDFVVNGKRVFRSCRTRNKVQALRKEKEAYLEEVAKVEKEALENEQANGTAPNQGSVMALSAALDRVFKEKWSGQSDGSHAYSRVKKIIEQLNDPPLDQIRKDIIVDLKEKLRNEGRAPATVNRYLAHLKFILRWARDEWGVLESVPKISMAKETTGRTRVLTQDEQEKLCKVLREQGDNSRQWYWPIVADLVNFLCETGLRLSEALNLDSSNLDEVDNCLILHPEDTKSSRPRVVPLGEKAQEILNRRGSEPFKDIDLYQANRAFSGAKAKLGLEQEKELCLHACRHTCASRLLASGSDLYTVKTLLGHVAWATTERYSHLNYDHLQKAIQRL